jgi:hypothetical protein
MKASQQLARATEAGISMSPSLRNCLMGIADLEVRNACRGDAEIRAELLLLGIDERDIAFQLAHGATLVELVAQSQYSAATRTPTRAVPAPMVVPRTVGPVAAPRVAPAAPTAPPAPPTRSAVDLRERAGRVYNAVLVGPELQQLAKHLIASASSIDEIIGVLQVANAAAGENTSMSSEVYGRIRAQRDAALAHPSARKQPTASTPASADRRDVFAFRRECVAKARAGIR